MNNNSTANGPSPHHMHYQYGRNDMPGPQRPPKRSVLSRFKEKFQEKEVTPEEVRKLGLKARAETYKTQIQRAKSSRPSRFDGIIGNSGGSRGRARQSEPAGWLFTDNSSQRQGSGGGGLFSDNGSEPSFSFITGVEPKGRGRKQESGFGKGITDLF